MTKTTEELEAGLNFLRVGLLAIAAKLEPMQPFDRQEVRSFVDDLIAASASGAPEEGAEPPVICLGCGTNWSDAELLRRREADPRIVACCPERKMVPVSELLTRLNDAERASASMQGRLDELDRHNRAISEERDAMRWRLLNAADAIMLLADRAKATPQELAQLGLATYVKDQAGNAHSIFSTLDDLKEAIDSDMKRQATTAKFRQLKQHFVLHQRAVTKLLDRLSSVTTRNTISGEDVQKLRDLRLDLQAAIGREI